jgi:TPR repeat protein
MLKKILLTLLLVSSLFAMDARLNQNVHAKNLYQMATQENNADAAFDLGIFYSETLKDYKEAIVWYEKAYKMGTSGAAYNLGYLYKNDLKNYKKAEEWYLKAIEQNDPKTPGALGLLYKNHFKDYPKAIKWYKKAYEIGDIGGAFNLGNLYKNHFKDYKNAIAWYKKGAKKGDFDSINNLGGAYHKLKDNISASAYILALLAYGEPKKEIFNFLKNDWKIDEATLKKAYQLQKTLDIPKHYYDAELEENPTSKTTNPRGQR